MNRDLVPGDRVSRTGLFPNELPKNGKVTRVYRSISSHTGDSIALYAVQWDGKSYEEIGYLRNGLEHEALRVPTAWFPERVP